jgi:predicted DNA binding CopG/RHH family protein
MQNKTSTVGRPQLPLAEKRKARSIKMSDREWEEIQKRAAKETMNVSKYIREKLLREE